MNAKLMTRMSVILSLAAACAMAAPTPAPATPATKAPVTAPATTKAADLKVIELSKEDALGLMSMQYTVGSVEANLQQLVSRRQDLIKRLEDKYKLSINDYIFDISTGFFVPRKVETADKKPVAPPAAESKPIEVGKEDSLQVTNIQYAIESSGSDLRQLYTKRQELVKKLEETYKITLADYDLDVMTGRFIERAKTDVAPKADAAK